MMRRARPSEGRFPRETRSSPRKNVASPVTSDMSHEQRSRKSMNWMLGFRAGTAKHHRWSGGWSRAAQNRAWHSRTLSLSLTCSICGGGRRRSLSPPPIKTTRAPGHSSWSPAPGTLAAPRAGAVRPPAGPSAFDSAVGRAWRHGRGSPGILRSARRTSRLGMTRARARRVLPHNLGSEVPKRR